ncbi:MAG TPA: pyrroline-5-carboxylate reductase dimerization domain-containing protein [Sphingobium sp.]|nr:pyrroline-5-carboxylate reductase dimerization domain-containing protein [Sphingobium sp.]
MVENWPAHLLLIGCGNMAGAMLARWLDCGLPPERVTVIRPSGKPVADGVTVRTQLAEPVAAGTVVLLGCKPQQLAQVAQDLAGLIGADTRMLSILAGVPVAQLHAAFGQVDAIIRCMPNLPVRTGHGVSTLHADRAVSGEARALATELCAPLGLVEWLDDEQLFDAATALAGCGPAFVYRFIDALGGAGASLGLDPAQAARMALATVAGAAISAANADASPAAMADAVASKGGMTREGLDVLDRPGGLVALLDETLRAARDRGAALAALSAKN